jgi:putative membrane protein
MVKIPLNADAIARIEAVIGSVEKSSRAELVAVIATRASEYRVTGLSLATLGAFAAGILVWAFLPWSGAAEILLAEFAFFLGLLALLELTPLGDRLTPRRVKAEAARRLARATFLEQGLAATPERNAVIFFVSLAEHHVEIIADGDLHQRVGEASWREIVDTFTAAVRRGDLEAGFVASIEALGELLAQHYPVATERPNALANRLIVLA